MKKYLLMLGCLITIMSKAQTPDANHPAIKLWPKDRLIETVDGKKLTERDVTRPNGQIAGKATTLLTDIADPTITIYKPQNANGTAVIVCPGGGYSVLAIDLEGTEICSWLNSFGVTAILLKYRVPVLPGKPRYELPLQDVQRALGLVRYNAEKWHIKADHIGILGFSAGGHLSAAISNNYEKRTYPTVDAADAVSCKPDFAILIYPAYLKDDAAPWKLAPEVQVTANTPPTIIVQTEDDPIDAQNALTYYAELKKFKVPSELHLFAAGKHGYGMRLTQGGISTYPKLIEWWLKDNWIK